MLWAHVLTSLVANLISVVVVVLVALLMGFHSGAGVPAWLAVAGILILFTLALTFGSPSIPGLNREPPPAARARSPTRSSFCRSSAQHSCPPTRCPDAVRAFAENQPVTTIVNTIRDLLTQQPVGTDIWIALAWLRRVLVVAYTFAMITYRRKIS